MKRLELAPVRLSLHILSSALDPSGHTQAKWSFDSRLPVGMFV
jgi:hypothetical protein